MVGITASPTAITTRNARNYILAAYLASGT
jgi:hypothetical protein